MIAIVVPCFNEASRLDAVEFSRAVRRYPDWRFLFVDDGSTDSTAELLEALKHNHGSQVCVVRLEFNRGKGEAVRTGMRAALDDGATLVAYMDADASTPFDEVERLIGRIESEDDIDVVLGARIRLLGNDVRRNPLRHIVGRVYGTLASLALGAPVYDTQCGAKAFRGTESLVEALSIPFIERWAFDVELLSRLAGYSDRAAWARIVEEPLQIWHARAGSKVRLRDGPCALLGLARIAWHHRRARQPSGRCY